MNGVRIMKNGLTRIGIWCALVGVTVVLTVLFSFLGTLTGAVVAGVMLGSARRWQWKAIPVSLVFPAVILGLSHYSKIELPPEKVYLIALVCGAAFWAVYGMTFSLHILEQREETPATMATGRSDPPGHTSGTESGAAPGFSLASLRGIWTCEDTAADGSTQHKTLRIEDGKFALIVNEPGGRGCEIARGGVNVNQSGANEPVVTLKAQRPDHADGW
jgi:hypothetical protein